jgi:metal-sulfur cluster biosynthetic enzyme
MTQPITTSTTVREAVTSYPGAERIFDKHGLTGCGGPDGPAEPIGFFAAVHHVEPRQLVAELNEYAASLDRAPEPPRPALDAGGHTYPLFLTTSLLLALVVGVTTGIAAAITGGGWGALRGEAWLALVQTHGHVQVFGYLGLFVMGMALHVLPRFKGQRPPNRRLVFAIYVAMLSGVTMRALAQPHGQGFLRWMLGASALFELTGAALFAAVVIRIFWRARARREPFDRFILSAIAWLVACAGINAFLTLQAAHDGRRLLSLAGDAALLEAVVYGFIVLFVLGVSFRALPFFLSLKPPYGWLGDISLAAILVALPVRVAAVWAPQFGHYGWTDAADYIATFTLALGVAAAVIALRVFDAPAAEANTDGTPPAARSVVQAAYAWLLLGAMLDVYWRLRELDGGFTPYYAAGAIRHAFLLGFATLMIMVMAYRTVPVFSGRPVRWPAAVPASYVMVIAAGVLRVFPVAFTLAPTTLDFKLLTTGGVLLFFGLGIFFVELLTSMFARFARAEHPVTVPAAAAPRGDKPRALRAPTERGIAPGAERADAQRPAGPVRADMTVAEALELSPLVLTVLLDYGFGPIADPEVRARMAPATTIGRAAAFLSADPDALVDTLNMAIGETRNIERGDGVAPISVDLVDTAVTEEALRAALKTCYDPEIPVNIVDLGLVYGVAVRDAYAHVTMTLTAPGCPMADEVEDQVRGAMGGVPGIETVDVDVVEQPPWSPARMSPAARAAVGW